MARVTVELGSNGLIARVTWVAADGREMYLLYRTGATATVTRGEPFDFEVGDIVHVHDDDVDAAPGELWPPDRWAGIVRAVLPATEDLGTQAIVAGRGDVKVVALNDVACDEGNTVEVEELRGVVRKLDDRALSYLQHDEIESGSLEQFKPPTPERELTFDDFGGLDGVKKRAVELVELPLERHAELAEIGARPIKGVLFTGDPGTGKTMLARIIASRAKAEFYEISGPQIFSKWLGESEAILRRVFEDAAAQERSIIFFDEIDSVAPARAGDANEASRRVVAQLLVQMDGFTPDTNVVVIAATNRPGDLDGALRRPGRFDWEVEFPMPQLEDRVEILRVSGARLKAAGDLDHSGVAARTDGWSGAELAAIWSEAALLAVADGRTAIMDEDYFGGFERVRKQLRRVRAGRAQPLAAGEEGA